MASIRLNTDKEYPCLLCGTLGNIIRESDAASERRIKCNSPRCAFVYSAQDSIDAVKAGVIPDGPRPEEPDVQPDPVREEAGTDPHREEARQAAPTTKAPRTPSFVILSRDRTESEFCTKKNLKERVIQWVAMNKKFDVFELTPKKVQATLSIQ